MTTIIKIALCVVIILPCILFFVAIIVGNLGIFSAFGSIFGEKKNG